ncbi:MAG TPA: sugar transferase [Solirubrobacteraceae bacterium]|nr:sugar transferase [Solirubrobacteraceae bacterium]
MVVRRTRPAAPIPTRPQRRPAKRCLDVVLSAVALTLTLPVLLVVAALLKLEHRDAPVLLRQRRAGRNGRPFTIVKFRTMVPDAEQRTAALVAHSEVAWPDLRLHDDPRGTRLGRFLRRTSIDQLPQLVNVLRGEMSLVGPRPTSFTPATYTLWQSERLEFTPGLTGPWQVHGRTSMDFTERCRTEIAFCREASLRRELVVLVRTVAVVARRTGTA